MKNFWIITPGNLQDDKVVSKSDIPENVNITIPKDQILNIVSFLKFLYLQKEFEVYYFLFNKVEIKSFKNNTLEISCKASDQHLIKQVSKLLSLWKNEQCNISISKQETILPFKSVMISEVKSDNNWKLISKSFPDAIISDLLYE